MKWNRNRVKSTKDNAFWILCCVYSAAVMHPEAVVVVGFFGFFFSPSAHQTVWAQLEICLSVFPKDDALWWKVKVGFLIYFRLFCFSNTLHDSIFLKGPIAFRQRSDEKSFVVLKHHHTCLKYYSHVWKMKGGVKRLNNGLLRQINVIHILRTHNAVLYITSEREKKYESMFKY